MDVGYYLGELLMQTGKVKIPGLGSFLQVRMSAYYDENERLFYPPFNSVHFEPQTDEGDTELADYLVVKKGISLASAKYFIEKYIANLKQQAIVADVPLGNIGVFYTERAELTFKPSNSLNSDSEFYGYAPVKIFKADAISAAPEAVSTPELVYPPILNPDPVITERVEEDKEIVEDDVQNNSVQPNNDEAFSDIPEEDERKGPLRAILITVIILAVAAGGLFALYTYQPATFAKLQFWKNNKPKTPVKARPSTIVIPGIDSVHTDSAKTALDTAAAAGLTDTVKTKRFELISGKGFRNLWGVNDALKKYRKMGLTEARILEELPGSGTLYKISIASFNTVSESEAMRLKLIAEGKLTKGARTIEFPKE